MAWLIQATFMATIIGWCCSCGQKGEGTTLPPQSLRPRNITTLKAPRAPGRIGLGDRSERDQRKGQPLLPGPQLPGHPSLLSCYLWGWAWRWGEVLTTRTATPFGQALVSCFLYADWPRWSPFPRGKSHVPMHSAWRSQNPQIITGGTIDALVRLLMTINSLSGSLLSKCHREQLHFVNLVTGLESAASSR